MKKKFFIFVMGVMLVMTGGAQVEIKKSAPEEIKINEILTVTINVTNHYSEDINVILTEVINFGEPVSKKNLVQPQNVTEDEEGAVINGVKWLNANGECEIGCVEGDGICEKADCGCTYEEDSDCIAILPSFPHYEWEFNLKEKSKKTLWYKVKMGRLGSIEIPRTVAETSKGTFRSNFLTVKVKCDANGICEEKENFGNCPEDCESGREDGYCDGILDRICDPDCEKEQDPDCIPPKCGDGKCEKEKNESYQNCPEDCEKPVICGDDFCDERENFGNCPEDCESGGKDGYCDGVEDGICDPDCRERDFDPDCLCNEDGKCEVKFENYGNCPEDCESGGKDGYCDGVEDGICDPDCSVKEDPDCGKKGHPWQAIIVIAIGLLLLFIVYRKLKKG